MRWILDCLYLIAGLCLLPYWLWKLPRGRRYRAGILQRLGFAPPLEPNVERLWIHCASVGEATIPATLVPELRRLYPGWDIVFSTNTDTGADRLRALYPDHTVFFMPLDITWCVGRAFRRIRPTAVVLVELEVWPNFLEQCRRRGVPVAIVNGRISSRSSRRLRVGNRLLRHLWDAVEVCCARSAADAAGFVAAGVPEDRVFNCGSLKYDVLPAAPDPARVRALATQFGIQAGAPVFVAGSTHDGEETVIAAAYRDLRIKHPTLRLVVVPRHIERAAAVRSLLLARGFTVSAKTALDQAGEKAGGDDVILVDTIGDLIACYALADVVFVGRSLVRPGGGQNMMEPAVLGKPVLVGPHTSNFRPEMRLLKERGGVRVVEDRAQLTGQADILLSDKGRAERMGKRARRAVEESRGATERTLGRLRPVLDAAPRVAAGRRSLT